MINEIFLLSTMLFFVQLIGLFRWMHLKSQMSHIQKNLKDMKNKKELLQESSALGLASMLEYSVSEHPQKPSLWITDRHLDQDLSFSMLKNQMGLSLEQLWSISLVMMGLTVLMPNSPDQILLKQLAFGFSGLSVVATWWISSAAKTQWEQFKQALTEKILYKSSSQQNRESGMQAHVEKLIQDNAKVMQNLERSHKILADLGTNLSQAFQNSIQEQLAPSLKELTELATSSQRINQQYVKETTNKHNQAVQALIADVMVGIDKAIGGSLRDTSESFAASVQKQQVSMDRWRRSVDSVSDVIASLEQTTVGLTAGAAKMAKAAQPVETAASVFAESAKQLQEVFPVLSEISRLVLGAQEGLQQSHQAIRRGTEEYMQVSSTVRGMVQELNESHLLAIQRISQGVDEAVLAGLRETSSELQKIHHSQKEELGTWLEANQQIVQTLNTLKDTSIQLSGFATKIENASQPTVQASKAFLDAANQLGNTIPQLQDTVQVHQLGAKSLEEMSHALQGETQRYNQTLEKVQELVATLENTQNQMAERLHKGVDDAISDGLIKAQDSFVQSMSKASELVNQSSIHFSENFEQASHKWQEKIVMTSDNWEKGISNSVKHLEESMKSSSQEWLSASAQSKENLSSVGSLLANQITQGSTVLSLAFTASQKSIEQAGTQFAGTVSQSGQNLQQALQKSGSDINVSLEQVRQQLAKTIESALQNLQSSLQQAGQSLVQDWGQTGNDIRDVLANASQNLDKSVQEVGRKLNQRIDEAGQSLEKSAQISAESIQNGALQAQERLSNVGDGWSKSIDFASASLKNNAALAGDLLSGALKGVDAEIQSNIAQLHQDMLQTLERSIQKQQKLLDDATSQQQNVQQTLLSSGQNVQNLMTQSIQESQSLLRKSAEEFVTDLQIALKEVFQVYESSLLQASRQQSDSAGLLVENAEQAGLLLKNAIQQGHQELNSSIANIGKEMVQNLSDVHGQFSSSLEKSTTNLQQLVSVQEQHIGGWQSLVDTLTPALGQLNGSTRDLNKVIDQLQQTLLPAKEASDNFRIASSQIQAVFPNISETAESYHRFNQSLVEANSALAHTAGQYSQTSQDMMTMLTQVQHTLDLQSTSSQSVSDTLLQVNQTIELLSPIVQTMGDASKDIRLVSENTTHTIDNIQRAAAAQNEGVQQMGKLSAQLLKTLGTQANKLSLMTDQMGQLQNVLTVGVDAFAQKLPESVDKTLVNFDAALADGVLRLGGSIERLRDAMDDMIEQLDQMKRS